jgi:hypothetical protein
VLAETGAGLLLHWSGVMSRVAVLSARHSSVESTETKRRKARVRMFGFSRPLDLAADLNSRGKSTLQLDESEQPAISWRSGEL